MAVNDRRTEHPVAPEDKIRSAEKALARFERENNGQFTEAHKQRMQRLKAEIAAMRRDVTEVDA